MPHTPRPRRPLSSQRHNDHTGTAVTKFHGVRDILQDRRAEAQHERSDIQQERIDLAARELTEVGDRLQAAANALRESV
jgi:hypothetical protein